MPRNSLDRLSCSCPQFSQERRQMPDVVEQSSLDSDATTMMRVPQCPDQQCCQQEASQTQFLYQPLLWLLSPSLPFLFVLWEDETTATLSPSMPSSWRLDLAVSQKQDKGQGDRCTQTYQPQISALPGSGNTAV